jgi:hypothetical protein
MTGPGEKAGGLKGKPGGPVRGEDKESFMAHSEACQLFIEQQIKEALEEGKTSTEAAKEVMVAVQKMFEVAIPFETLRSRARYITQKAGEITGSVPTQPNSCKSQEKPSRDESGRFEPGTVAGPGRPQKYPKPQEPWSPAMQLAGMATSNLGRISPDDPDREKAFDKVISWINNNRPQKEN